ncbi:MAG: hypothetical protein VW806_06700 [Halieaceae bacterium]
MRPHDGRFFAHATVKIEGLTTGPGVSDTQLEVAKARVDFLKNGIPCTGVQQDIVADSRMMLHRLSAIHDVPDLIEASVTRPLAMGYTSNIR